MPKPTPTQLLALSGLRDQLALGGKPLDAQSPFWRPLRASKWLSEDGRLTPEGVEAANRYQAIPLICRHCETTIATYVAELGVTKELRRVCRTCGSERQRFVVDGSGFEAVGLTVSEAIERLPPSRSSRLR
ncbi:MAG: hypothetical protein DRN81_05155 [Thermoproteota archaeon]|nr:MAG: hypothetical protein DRN81_05155 [Candidatus Korarchaeota archaeon]